MSECLFCKLVSGAIPSDKVYEDGDFLAFRDISPQAPTHVLLIPKRHIPALTELRRDDADLAGALMLTAAKLSSQLGLDSGGYRWVVNCGENGCQSVPHVHLHILGGRMLGWPPG
ncbi:histidine triad nucleotide-binding protein [bacterium]|nr:histidine triad nucleotide-binding protein [bacterium]MBU1071688.1 histidine triad nucleotide-binding protein [bacterium]MBU1675368.1 histidine triad nucleotide-binding protein [bacterium]